MCLWKYKTFMPFWQWFLRWMFRFYYFFPVIQINIEVLEHIISLMPSLEILNISQLGVSDVFLELIAEKLPCLMEVNVNVSICRPRVKCRSTWIKKKLIYEISSFQGCPKISKMGMRILSSHGVRVLSWNDYEECHSIIISRTLTKFRHLSKCDNERSLQVRATVSKPF